LFSVVQFSEQAEQGKEQGSTNLMGSCYQFDAVYFEQVMA